MEGISIDFITNIDKNIILFLNNFIENKGFIKELFSTLTSLGDGGFIWIMFAFLLFTKKNTRSYGIFLIISLLLGNFIGNNILKNLFKRPRPFIELGISPFISPPGGFSFPSGHSLSSFVGATCIYKLSKGYGIGAYMLALLIAISRPILLVHYPSDIITGAILGIIISNVVYFILEKLSFFDYNRE